MSARARQLNHRLKNRKNAIISRREAEAATSDDFVARSPASSGHNIRGGQPNGEQRSSISPPSGFVAVNQRSSNPDVRNDTSLNNGSSSLPESLVLNRPSNGTVMHGASPATRAELLSKFFTNSERAAALDHDQGKTSTAGRPVSSGKAKFKHGPDSNIDAGNSLLNSGSPIPIPHTPSNLLPYAKFTQQERFDDSGPYKGDMMARMEQLYRGDRVQPPCDRCRRLHMDCLKNLTACMGCTKKHAKCSWKDVTEQELRDNPLVLRSVREEAVDTGSGPERERSRDPYSDLPTISHNNPPKREPPREEDRAVRDEELLGEEASDDEEGFPHRQHRHEVVTQSPPTAVMTTSHAAPVLPTVEHVANSLEQPFPPKDQEHNSSAILTSRSDHESRPLNSTNGFQSVNVKGVVVGYDPIHQDEEEKKNESEQSDKERAALIQLSAAAQQVSEYQRQQHRAFSGEREQEQHAQAQQT